MMNHIVIRRPKAKDVTEIKEFFRIVLTDTFLKEGIGQMVEDMEEEIEIKNNYLNKDILSEGQDRYFLLALYGDKIIGSIEYGPASDIINNSINHTLNDMNEIGTVFVHPNYQRQGIGNQLLIEMYVTLKNKKIEEICLDSGYKGSQKIWKKKFGEPNYLLKDYWGEGIHHMIWRLKVNDLLT